MSALFITDRSAVAAASELIEFFGEEAGPRAAEQARVSRSRDNVRMFCHWRQVERLIEMLSVEEVLGTVH